MSQREKKFKKSNDERGQEGAGSLAQILKFEGLRNSESLIGWFRRQHFDWSLSHEKKFFVEMNSRILHLPPKALPAC